MDAEHVWRRSLVAAFAVFALWEALKHLLLMEVPMFVQHGLSAIIEVGLALLIVVLAVRGLAAQQRELDRAREMRDRLASALANDLRQPMLTVVESLDRLGQAPELPGSTRRVVERALESVHPLVGMAVELLRVAPPQEEGQEMQPLSCSHLLRSAIDTVRVIAAAKRVEIREGIAEPLPPIRGLPHSLFSAFVNLLDNAVRSTPMKGEVSVACHAIGPHGISIQITDGGPGLSAQEHEVLEGGGARNGKVLWPADHSLRSGLQFVAAAVSAHGGDIHAESSEERGNTVVVSLPIEEEGRAVAGSS